MLRSWRLVSRVPFQQCAVTCRALRFAGGQAPLCALLSGVPGYAAPAPSLQSGAVSLQFPRLASGGYGLRWQRSGQGPQGKSVAWELKQDVPLAAEVVDAKGAAVWITGSYTKVAQAGRVVTGSGVLVSANGTHFRFSDAYQPEGKTGALHVSRTVRVETANPADTAFSSRFSLPCVRPTTTRDCDFFVPGIWYKDNAHVPPKAIANHLDDRFFYLREDRLPLPLTLWRDRRTGATVSMQHIGGVPTTFAGEDGLTRITDTRMQFGALGFVTGEKAQNLTSSFLFPGTEGERTYIYGGSTQGNRWAYRSHPITTGFAQRYALVIRLENTPDYPTAVRQAWRGAYALAAPPVLKADLNKVYRASMDLLATYCRKYHGVPSLPFFARVPDGEATDISSQMGFVGQALPDAALLLQHSLESGDAATSARASDLVDFWVANAATPSGVLRTWYDIHADGTFTWRPYFMFLRVASDGMDGALQAWNIMRRHGQDKPAWLAFCRRYGDWLARTQNPDGSFFRSYDFTGGPQDRHLDTSDHPIKFLVDLYKATGDATYKTAAVRAGEFCLKSVHSAYAYVGGTPDNPNVTDKEAGMMALDAFLALHDATGDKRWLDAASQAAWYSETWVYLWNIPMPSGDPKQVFPKNRTTVGLSLIATGHSGADAYMAAAPFLYYRLSLLTGETHFRDVAYLLLHDTKQMLDWDGKLGYKYPGLLVEALSLPPLRGHGVSGWLPWLTFVVLEPMVRLRDTFGAFDIETIERLPQGERLRRNAHFAATRGFLPPLSKKQ